MDLRIPLFLLLQVLAFAPLQAQDCLPDQIRCGGACVDPTTDPMHCGACDAACYSDEACTGGICGLIDSDNDGWSDQEEESLVGICDPNDPAGYPKPDVCNGLDDDCNGIVDDTVSPGETCAPTVNTLCVDPACTSGACIEMFAEAGRSCGTDGAACDGNGQCVLNPTSIAFPRDTDADGFVPPTDCNDNFAGIRPGLGETCDGFDNDCDASVDEGVSCDDGNVCTSNDRCAGSCRNRPRPDGTPCGAGSICLGVACVAIELFGSGFEPAPPTR